MKLTTDLLVMLYTVKMSPQYPVRFVIVPEYYTTRHFRNRLEKFRDGCEP
jgi:hypothetical protein